MSRPIRDSLATGLVDRLRTLVLALDRQDRLETAEPFVGWLAQRRASGRLGEDAREMLLRALRLAGDDLNYRILTALDPVQGVALAELMRRTGLERVPASERVNDLAQVGLAVREMIGDEVRGTALASGLVQLIEEVSGEAGRRLGAELAGAAAEAEGGDG